MSGATDGTAVIELNEAIDGDEIGSRNYRFNKVGEPVPINSDGSFQFEPQSLPSQPLAVSELFRLLFVAHPQGFYVARTKDVMASAEEIKEKKTGSCVQELSLVDVSIGKVSILALSIDDSLLAATVGSRVHFFAVSALLHKEQKPSYSVPVDDSSYIRSVHWSRKVAKAFLILSSSGKLYHGSGQGPINYLMDGVDSVDWSIKGNFVAVAKKNVVSILSSQFKEKLSFLLSFQSMLGDSDANQVIKVDSIRWIRPDSIVVGCFQLNDEGEEENYIIHVITSRGGRITDVTEDSKPIILSFNNVFVDWCSEAVQARNGPHLFFSYLDLYGLAFVANKNLSNHVALFCWHDSGKNEAALVEILNDVWALHIDYQGNGDENEIIGLSVDKVSQNENEKLTMGNEEREVPPCCVIMCLTIDGNISVFHFASATGTLLSSDGCVSHEEDDASQISSIVADERREPTFSVSQSQKLSIIEVEKTKAQGTTLNDSSRSFNIDIRPQEENSPENMGHKSFVNSKTLNLDGPEKSPSIMLSQNHNSENKLISEVEYNKGVFSGTVAGDVSHQSVNNYSLLEPNVDPLRKVLPPENTQSVWPLTNSSASDGVSKTSEVEDMARKLDILLESVEGEGGFLDASITSQKNSLVELEKGILALSDRVRSQRGLTNEQQTELQLLLDMTVEVLVRKVYMEGIFKQATDCKYWELWNRQKLSSEMELKRRHILELDQELTNKLIELERHFNSLEFNKFRENEEMQRQRRALQNLDGHSRQIQSLRSLHNTMTAQLAAAEQLSGCLSNQIAALSIESSGKQDVKKKLFESIGLTCVGDTEISPARNRTFDTPENKEYFIASGSVAAKGQSRRKQTSFAKGCEPETTTQRRDSFNRSWTSFDPPKTTLKRTLKEDNEKGSSNRALINISKQFLSPQSQKKSEVVHSATLNTSVTSQNHYKSKGFAEASVEQFTESTSTSLYPRTTEFQGHGVLMSSTNSYSALSLPSALEARTAQSSDVGAFRLADETSQGSLPFSGKNNSFAASESKREQQSDTNLHPLPSMSAQLSEQSFTSPSYSTESVNRFKIGFTKSVSWDQKNPAILSDTPLFDAKIPSTSDVSSESGLFSKNSEKTSYWNDGLSASSPSQSVLGSSPTTSLMLKPNSSTIILGTPKSSDVKQEESHLQPSVTSPMNFLSTLPSLTHGSSSSSVFFSSSIVKSGSPTSLSQPSAAMYGSKTEGISEMQSKVDNMPSTTETGDKIETVSAAESPNSTSGLKPGPLPLTTLSVLSTNSNSDSQSDLGGLSKNSFVVTPAVKVEMPSASETLPAVPISSEGIDGSMKNAMSNSSHEEEMEEEAPDAEQTTEFAFSNLGGFGVGSTQNISTSKTNPFGIINPNSSFASSPYSMSTSGELFRPASFSFQSPHPAEPIQPTTINIPGGFSSVVPGQVAGAAGFGQPAHIGAGQQALGIVLGSFGQSRQIGTGLPGSNGAAPAGGFGGGFATAPLGGGFASLGAGGGGFAAAATAGGGFAAAATAGGGFAAAGAGSVSGGGGFGAFSNQPGGGVFGGSSGSAQPPSQLFTQMRK